MVASHPNNPVSHPDNKTQLRLEVANLLDTVSEGCGYQTQVPHKKNMERFAKPTPPVCVVVLTVLTLPFIRSCVTTLSFLLADQGPGEVVSRKNKSKGTGIVYLCGGLACF